MKTSRPGRTEGFKKLSNTPQSIEYYTDEAKDKKDIGSWVFILERGPQRFNPSMTNQDRKWIYLTFNTLYSV